ncbi:MAG: hypothetical protein Kow00121_26220 [Elainellaceae cyanobacterium]
MTDFSPQFPNQRWRIARADADKVAQLAQVTQLPPLIAQVLLNRGIDSADAHLFLEPERQHLPSPLDEFPDLPIALEVLLRAIATRQPIAICGDYDADGMTSTALLLRALREMGGIVDYAIPSRMQEGYGINQRIVEEFHDEGVSVILTVDNGIAAYEPIARARELGLTVIVTDHHDIPEQLPPANAILNPKLISAESPYCGIAGVGVAYVLAICLAQCLQKTQDLTTPLIELFTLGTIADLAPLIGVNRRWVKRGLKLLPRSRIPGIQALIQVAGLSQEKQLKPEAIGFRLGPRINAIGRIADPQIVIELLTTEDDGRALELAMKCEQINQLRQRLCELIEQEAIAWCEESQVDCQRQRVLVVVQPDWHHGVIGIVASRLVERYGVPVFIGTYEEDDPGRIRGSARSIPEFHVFEALQFCGDLLDKYGGHRAAGGFSLKAENLEEFRSRLSLFAHGQLQPEHLKPLVTVDAQADFSDVTLDLYEQMDVLHPCGIENPDPVFWTPNVRVVEQQTIGRDKSHLRLTLAQASGNGQTSLNGQKILQKAIAWRWGSFYPLPSPIDVAYRLRLNDWNGEQTVQLELIGVRLPQKTTSMPVTVMHFASSEVPLPVTTPASPASNPTLDRFTSSSFSGEFSAAKVPDASEQPEPERSDLQQIVMEASEDFAPTDIAIADSTLEVEFYYSKRLYSCGVSDLGADRELQIRNSDGQVLTILPQQRKGWLGEQHEESQEIDISHPHYYNLIRAALCAIELAEKEQQLQEQADLLQEQAELLAAKDRQIADLQQQLESLAQQLSEASSDQSPLLNSDQVQALYAEIDQQQQTMQTQAAEIADLRSQLQKLQTVPEAASAQLDFKQQARNQLGDTIWRSLNLHSQKDLVATLTAEYAIQVELLANPDCDYSEIGACLCAIVEREVVQPFFKHLHQFLKDRGTDEIGGIQLKARKKYSLSILPALLSEQWESFQESVLENHSYLSHELFEEVIDASVRKDDRLLIQKFLEQWQHTSAQWLQASEESASAIAKLAELSERIKQKTTILYEWQYQIVKAIVIGNENQTGILPAIYDPP